MLGIIRDMVYFALIYLTDMASFIFIVLFHFIIDLVGIFMMMINIKKIELSTVSESCLQILFSVETELVYRLNYGPRVYINYGQKVSSGVMSSNKIVNFAG